jgi:hypothetical protein
MIMQNKIEILQFSITRLDKLISDADNKANFLLCFSIVILGAMIFVANDIITNNCFYLTIVLLTFFAFSASSMYSFKAIFPRYKKYNGKLTNAPQKSILFFRDISETTDETANLEGLTEQIIELDYLNQMKQLSIIINRKMGNIKVSVWFTGIGTVLAIAVFIATFFV